MSKANRGQIAQQMRDELHDWTPIPSMQDTRRSTTHVSAERKELETSMRRWGLDPQQDARHKVFWTLALAIVSDFVEGTRQIMLESHAHGVVKPDEVPREDRADALDGFLDAIIREVVDDDFEIIRDLLLERHPNLPFCPPYDWNTKLNPAFQHIPKSELDPLLRFVSIPVEDKREKLRECFERDELPYKYNNPTLLAMAAHHMTLPSTTCLKCMTPNTLRWNNALEARWMRMLCMQCGSLYSFFPKQQLLKKLKKYMDGGGRFDVFH